MNNKTVLYFEDNDDTAKEVEERLGQLLDGFADVERFAATVDSQEMYDARLEQEIAARQKAGKEIVFILSDADLSATKFFAGLSASNVHSVATKLGIPSAYYSSNLTGSEFLRADQAGDGRILLNKSDLERMTNETACLVFGFDSIVGILEGKQKEGPGHRPKDVAELLAILLGREEVANRVRLYIAGDQRLGAEFLSSSERTPLRKASILGTEIYDSLLKYPGLTVNEVAAASYLNISVAHFSEDDVRKNFAAALYEGPFSKNGGQLWWRDKLDEILLEAECEDGRELMEKVFNRDVEPCLCFESNAEPAGYVCMISQKPVCEDHSVGGLSWFPRGADLARISDSEYENIGPWLA